MTTARILQISNNVSEEFNDRGETSFATKKELCQVIQYFQLELNKWIELQRALAMQLMTLGLEAVTAKPK